ncbi:MAG: recombinase family protein [Dehalococcoidia bacterium]|nr:recombinase family protein [Dehalococcoidia bacterium]
MDKQYRRVSTEEQEQGTSLEWQLAKLAEVAPNALDYCDPGFTGTNGNRPALQRLLKDIQPGDKVYILKLDRLARNLCLLLDIEARLRDKGIPLISVTESIDTSTAFGRMIFQILGVIAEWEREAIIERTRNGRYARYQEGKWACGQPLHGYRYNSATKGLDIEEAEASVVRRIYNLYVYQRLGFEQVARLLNSEGVPPRQHATTWHKAAIRDIIHHPAYKGSHPRGVKLPAIIDPNLWELAQERSKENPHLHRREGSPWLLQGIVTCGLDGRTLACGYSHGKKGRRVYSCRGRLQGTSPSGDHRCTLSRLDAEWLEDKVWQTIETTLHDPQQLNTLLGETIDHLKQHADELERNLQPIDGQLGDIQIRKERLADQWVIDNLPKARWQQLKDMLDKKEGELIRIKAEQDPAQVVELVQAKAKLQVWQQASQHLANGGKLWPPGAWLLGEYAIKDSIDYNSNLTPEARRNVLDRLQMHLYAYPDRVELKGLLPLPPIRRQEGEPGYRSSHCPQSR